MAKYRITAARPKGATNHVKSQFKVMWWGTHQGRTDWWSLGWRSLKEVADFSAAGDDVRTGRHTSNGMEDGAPVELELRTTRNDSRFEISQLPDH